MVAIENKVQRYEKYKNSGVEWLGEIPEHWKVERGKWLFLKKERPVRKTDEIITCFRDGEVTLRSNRKKSGFTVALKEHGYQGIRKGDLVIHAMDAFAGAIGVSDSDGKSTPVYSVCVERYPNTINQYYYSYFLRSLALNGIILALAKGIRERSTDFRFSDFGELVLSFPPLQEQTAIAQFLDDKTTKIDDAIAIKEQQINLLKERKQILIHKAVTRGLDDSVPFKNSGVEWIGEIPEHWEVKRLKNFIANLESGVSVNASEAENASENEIGVLKTSCVYNYKFEFEQNKKVERRDLKRVACPVIKNRIIISRMNAPELVGASGLVRESYPNLFLPDRLWQTVFNKSEEIDVFWLSQVLITKAFRDCITSIASGSSPSMKNITKGDFLNLRLAHPPLSEQKEISAYIETASQKIETAIGLKEQEIEKLKEYKGCLINGVVTGKVRVC